MSDENLVPDLSYLVGERVRLVQCNDEWTKLTPGEKGTVTGADEVMRVVRVHWDSGSRLGLIENVDSWEVIQDPA